MAVIKIKEGFDARPEGIYVFQVKNIEVRTAEKGKNAGNQFLSWESIVQESPDHPDLVGESFYHTTPLGCSPRSKYYPLFAALGAGLREDEKEMEIDTDDFIGLEFVADVIITKVGDSERNEFKNVWSVEKFIELQNKASKVGTSGRLNPSKNTPAEKPVEKENEPSIQSSGTGRFPNRKLGGRAPVTETNKLDNFPS